MIRSRNLKLWSGPCRPHRVTAETHTGPGVVHNIWRCPVCHESVPRPFRPGRQRVYCANSCRQKAYRWRKEHSQVLDVADPPPLARCVLKAHALRSANDLVTPLVDPDGRRVTACGTFAYAARDRPTSSVRRLTNFYATDEGDGVVGARTCRRCVSLMNVPLRSTADVLAELGIFGRPSVPQRAA